jgi:hypothetical protein
MMVKIQKSYGEKTTITANSKAQLGRKKTITCAPSKELLIEKRC